MGMKEGVRLVKRAICRKPHSSRNFDARSKWLATSLALWESDPTVMIVPPN